MRTPCIKTLIWHLTISSKQAEWADSAISCIISLCYHGDKENAMCSKAKCTYWENQIECITVLHFRLCDSILWLDKYYTLTRSRILGFWLEVELNGTDRLLKSQGISIWIAKCTDMQNYPIQHLSCVVKCWLPLNFTVGMWLEFCWYSTQELQCCFSVKHFLS